MLIVTPYCLFSVIHKFKGSSVVLDMNLFILIFTSLVHVQKMLLLLEPLVSGLFRFSYFPSRMVQKHHFKGRILLLIQEMDEGNLEYL